MELEKDRYRFVMERPVIGPPGKRWAVQRRRGGCSAVLIAKGNRRSLPDYARAALFDTIGIGRTEWVTSIRDLGFRQSGTSDGPSDEA